MVPTLVHLIVMCFLHDKYKSDLLEKSHPSTFHTNTKFAIRFLEIVRAGKNGTKFDSFHSKVAQFLYVHVDFYLCMSCMMRTMAGCL